MQWPERGKAGRIGPAQRKSVEGMYVGCRGQGRGSSWAQELWYSQVRVQPVLQRITGSSCPSCFGEGSFVGWLEGDVSVLSDSS